MTRGQQIAQIIDWKAAAGGASSNTHLHYVLISEAVCDKSVSYSLCGYDKGDATIGLPRSDTSKEPYYYTSVNDACGSWVFQDGFISPTKFIQDNHY